MSEIPADVMETAQAVASAYGMEGANALEAIASAIMAERERCAKITEDWQSDLVIGERINAAIKRLAGRIRGNRP